MIPETKKEDNGQLFLRFSWQFESILGNFVSISLSPPLAIHDRKWLKS